METDTWRCRHCGREVAQRLAACPRCKAEDGSSHGSTSAGERPSAGARRSARRADDSEWGRIWVGLVLVAVSGLSLYLEFSDGHGSAWLAFVFALVGALGWIFVLVGCIAEGVRLGQRSAQ